ncbi:MAG: SCO6880 family protein [Trebonia sp.]
MAATSSPTGRFARRSSRGVLLGFSGWRCVSLGAGAAGLLIGLLGGSLLLGMVLLAPFLAATFVRASGLYVVEWTPVVGHWALRKQTHQTRYRARPERPRPAGTLALPGDGAALRFYIEPEGGICVIHDPHRATLSAVLRVAHPAYALLSPDAQAQRVSMWGRAIASLGQSSACAGLQVLEATIPDSGKGIADYYTEHGAHQDGWAQEQYEALLASSSTGASTHRTTLTLSLDMRRAAGAVKAAGGGVKGAASVLRGDMAALEYVLRAADLKVVNWLSEGEIAQIVRVACDPGLGGEFRAQSAGANLTHAGPLGIDELWDRIHHDSGWSRVLWISEWPRIEVPAHFLHSVIFAPGVRKTLCLSMRPKGTKEALRAIDKEKTDMESDYRQKRKLGQIHRESDSQEWDDVIERERALISGHADIDFTGWIVVSAPTETVLDAATKQIERAAGQAGCETRVLFGRQMQAFIAAGLPVGRFTL